MDTLPEPLARVLRDAPLLVGRADLIVLPNDDPDARDDVVGLAGDWIADDASHDGVTGLLRLDGSLSALGDVAGADEDELTVLVASRVQDYVVDVTGAPWPLHRRADGTETVLDPRVDEAGSAVWADGPCPVAVIGELTGPAPVA